MEFRIPYLPWPLVWRRLWPLAWRPEEADTAFRLIHNILPVRGRLARFGGLGAASTCPTFPEVVETALHLFVECSRFSEVWEETLAHVYIYLNAIPSDADLSRLSGGRRHGHHAGLHQLRLGGQGQQPAAELWVPDRVAAGQAGPFRSLWFLLVYTYSIKNC